jgi:hypothetical protein
MKYAVEMGSGFITTGSGIQKLIAGIKRHTDRQKAWRLHKHTYICFFFQKKSRLIKRG